MTTTRWWALAVVGVLAAGTVPAAGCGDGGPVFACGGDGTPQRQYCDAASEYCRIAFGGGSFTTACPAIPASCSNSTTRCTCLEASVRASGGTNVSCDLVPVANGSATTLRYNQ